MSARRPHTQVVSGWLNDLSGITSGSYSLEEQRAKVGALTGVVADTFPDTAAFCKESLYEVSKNIKAMSFPEIHRLLGEWWERRRPRVFAPPAELDRAAMSAEDRANVMVWLKHDEANDLSARDFTMRLDVIRQCGHAGYQWLIGWSRRAKEIARAQGWLRDPEPEALPVSAPIAAVVEAMAPEPEPKPQPVEDFTAAFEAKHGRKPGALSAERLAEIRRANPGLQALADSAPVPKPPKQPPQPVAAAGGARRPVEPLQWD
jgi:hypothetical protein